MAWALLYILSILSSHCEEEMVLGRVWLARRNSNKSITAWSITRDIKYTTHYLQHSQDQENSSKQNFLHHLYLGFSKIAQIMVQRHLSAKLAVTRHWFASLLRLVWAPNEVKGLSLVMILVLAAVEALVSANIRSYSFILTTQGPCYPPAIVTISASSLGEGRSGGVIKRRVWVIAGVVRVGERLASLQEVFIMMI